MIDTFAITIKQIISKRVEVILRGQGVQDSRVQVKYIIITECLKFEKVVLFGDLNIY